VLNGGVVQQVGTPLDLYERPANRFVAQFIGSPTMNILPVVQDASGARLTNGAPVPGVPEGTAEIGIRPEHLELADPSAAPLRGAVDVVENLGSDTNIYAQIDGIGPLMVRRHGHVALRPGDALGLAWQPGRVHSFKEDGTAIRVG
jgi:multiple sugar transport system ATP-binding protein